MADAYDRTQVRDEGAWSSGLTAAIRSLRRAAVRRPTDDDRPPVSTFPLTPAAKAALAFTRQEEENATARLKPGKHRRTYGQ